MKIKRSKIIAVEGALKSIMGVGMGVDAAFKIASNILIAERESEIIKKAYVPVNGFDEYLNLRTGLLKKYGTPESDGSFHVPSENVKALQDDLEALDLEYKSVIDANSEYEKEFKKALEVEKELCFEVLNKQELTVIGNIEPSKLMVLIDSGIFVNGSE